ncbi:MAG: glycosyltransferase family 39 protein [Anaerolineae bacterium]|nr:glycosyltransferase family 39 protein [Anaerolineae bacterium]
MSEPENHAARKAFPILLAALLLVILFGLAVDSALKKSPTLLEGPGIAQGRALLRGEYPENAELPYLMSIVSGAFSLLETNLPPVDTLPGYRSADWRRISQALFWHREAPPTRLFFLARLPVIGLTLLLGAVTWRWARDLGGSWSGLLALGLLTFSPNILAHGNLAALDLANAAFWIGGLWCWSRYLHRRKTGWAVTCAVLLGLSIANGFPALIVILAPGLMMLPSLVRPRSGTGKSGAGVVIMFLALILGIVLTGWLVRPIPIDDYLNQLIRFQAAAPPGLAETGQRVYLLGHFSQNGWWYQPFILLGTKLPLITLMLLGLAFALAIIKGQEVCRWEICLPLLLILAVSAFTPLGQEMRSLLPILPLVFIFISRLAHDLVDEPTQRPLATGLAILPVILSGLLIHPHYLSFINVIGGGLENGAKITAGSNLDWGQDLPELARYMDRRGINLIYLSYYGDGDPAAYGINALMLPSETTPAGYPPPATFYPLNPAPGIYAISATNLVGRPPELDGAFGSFRNNTPVDVIGGSLYIYEVRPEALPESSVQPPWFARCAADPPLESRTALIEGTGIDDLQVFDFDCTQSLALREGAGWIMLPANIDPIVNLGPPDTIARQNDGSPRSVIWQNNISFDLPYTTIEYPAVPLPLPVAGYIDLLGYDISAAEIAPGNSLVVTTWWWVRERPEMPVTLFVHLLDSGNIPVVVVNGLGVATDDWTAGMIVVQRHIVPTGDLPPGSYKLTAGLIDTGTGQRLVVSETGDRVVDRIVLHSISVANSER